MNGRRGGGVEPRMNRPLLRALPAAALLVLAACFRADFAPMTLRVPALATARDLVLVTNAAQHELMGDLPDAQHFCEVDLARSLVMYHETPLLRDPAYVRRLMGALEQAGYPARVVSLQHVPTPPIRVASEPQPVSTWPDRHLLVLEIPAMRAAVDANRVVDALAYGRLGRRPDGLIVDPAARTVSIAHQNRRSATPLNFAARIASAGYAVEGSAAMPAPASPVARGWWPLDA